MILPIYAYGQSVLRKKASDVPEDYPELEVLITNMWETMYNSKGVGLAAPQIGLSIRLFMIDTLQIEDTENEEIGIKRAFINAEIVDEFGPEKSMEEGCLSIPDIRGEVTRKSEIVLKYYDEQWNEQEETFNGFNARVIQHEYDHIEGKLFTEKLQPLRKRLIKRKLEAIKKGNVSIDYRMRFAK